jgi:alkanesulfonate monooxygenase SsuD/methylene tetrahydromethanopterin reductase-like flavin-dependent oxidoreductase (luciferase family)
LATYGIKLQLPSPGEEGGEAFERTAEAAAAAEQAGFSELWVADSAWGSGGAAEPLTLLGALAVRTSRAGLGALVGDVAARRPGVLAKQATALDLLSGGRALLGLAARPSEDEEGVLGEAVAVIRALFRQPAPSFSGRHFRLEGAPNLPRPRRPGGPPLLVDGRRPAGLAVAARQGDACHLSGDPEQVRAGREALARLCRQAGRDASTVELVWSGRLEGGSWAEQAAAVAAAGADRLIVELAGQPGPAQVEAAGRALSSALD